MFPLLYHFSSFFLFSIHSFLPLFRCIRCWALLRCLPHFSWWFYLFIRSLVFHFLIRFMGLFSFHWKISARLFHSVCVPALFSWFTRIVHILGMWSGKCVRVTDSRSATKQIAFGLWICVDENVDQTPRMLYDFRTCSLVCVRFSKRSWYVVMHARDCKLRQHKSPTAMVALKRKCS